MTDTPEKKPRRSYQPAGAGESRNSGEAHGRSKLTEDAVRLARQLYRDGIPASDLAETCGVSVPTMWRALTGATWSFLPDPVEEIHPRPRKKQKPK